MNKFIRNSSVGIKKAFIYKALRTLMAGVERIELPSTVLETGILPLYHTPMRLIILAFFTFKCKGKKVKL